ncbi:MULTISPECIES: foldase protein PrsA [Priestia]|uniref:Foldase protein PrsA n=1 Tax=Priestia filamentosa TaxID=1402861 RepID=A0A1X7FLJ4_9BACI|nr:MULTISPECIES: peptidylprolyl isomerase [Priestia]AKO91360.1 foldase [Priestia filamentosa]MCM3536624.1 peptidylprolyl isomerase [Priestia endophytica]MDT3765481.1 peptidylprolyl isomerase [Priestia filamentosa]OXS67257.1 foldase [Priestia filamentosa]RJS65258.1 foldase [Priestia filamentosa]
MKKLFKRKVMYIILSVALVALIVCGGWVYSKEQVVASVDGSDITKDDVYNLLADQNGAAAVDTLITEKIIDKEAEKEDIKITAKQVNQELDDLKEQYGGEDTFNQTLEASGVSLSSLKEDIKKNKEIEELLRPSIKITEKEMKEYFNENKDSFAQAAQVKASHILVDDEKTAKEIKEKLDKGEDFATLAKKYSTDTATSESGGELGYFEEGTMTDEFDKKAFSMKKGEISDPVKTDYGYHIIKVEDVKEAKQASYKDSKAQVKEAIFNEKLQTEYSTWLEKKKKEYDITNSFE